MKQFDLLGVELADFQGRIFAASISLGISSAIFLRRFKNSRVAYQIDNFLGISWTLDELEALEDIKNEFGESSYGISKLDKDVLYWIGYIYRYISYTRNVSTKKLLSIVPYTKLASMYYAYHTQGEEYVTESIFELLKIDESSLIAKDKFKEAIRQKIMKLV